MPQHPAVNLARVRLYRQRFKQHPPQTAPQNTTPQNRTCGLGCWCWCYLEVLFGVLLEVTVRAHFFPYIAEKTTEGSYF